ncbi:MAG: kinase-like domain-containing protein [Olpidium bornovanus]|uniref:non-specific serine/threonine protein kinase n=1 Tax=Olpidium bornovanus TaxID=278681 RepID=A0A8H8DF12_9FUNG|nr:MAG: kinase-like domain-containing protein [Olpidium bornovanus]
MCWEKTAHKSKPGLLGSEPYIAPEIFQSVEYDAREVDVWACGIVYYCMLYQGIPWRMATPKDANYARYLEQRAQGAYEPLERLDKSCRNLLLRILEPDAAKRITVPEILVDPWFRSIACCSAETEIALARRDLLASTAVSTVTSQPDPLDVDRASSSPIPARRMSPIPPVPQQSHHHIPDDVLAAHLNRARRSSTPQ